VPLRQMFTILHFWRAWLPARLWAFSLLLEDVCC
jgi:hypothetical protein